MRNLIRNLVRFCQIIVVLFRYFIVPFVTPRRQRAFSGPIQVRLALEELGGAWIKLGQALALRFDLLPTAYCYELFKLLNQVKTFPYAQARDIVRQDLLANPEDVFKSFEQAPFGAASIGQVHRAVLKSGERVAVKVQRPDIRRVIRSDIALMYVLSKFVDVTRIFGATRTREIIDEFARWTEDELDFLIEARNAHQIRLNAFGNTFEKDAKVYWNYCSSRVLTMELIEGIPLIEIVYALQERDATYAMKLKAASHDLGRIARNIFWNSLNQIYQHGYFHADLHPANLFVLPGDAIAYVDFGITGKLNDGVRSSLVQYAWHLFQGDIERAASEFMRWIAPSSRTSLKSARQDITNLMEDYLFCLRHPVENLGKEGVAAFEMGIMQAIRRHEMVLSPEVVAYFKAVMTATTVIYELSPNFDMHRDENLFFARMIAQDACDWLDPRKLASVGFEYGFRVRRLFDAAEAAAESVEEGGEAGSSLLTEVRERVQLFGWLAIAGVIGLYAVLKFPRVRSIEALSRVPLGWFTTTFVVLIVISILAMIHKGRKLPSDRPRAGGYPKKGQ
jgi:ubiquinone biosynthesis protein